MFKSRILMWIIVGFMATGSLLQVEKASAHWAEVPLSYILRIAGITSSKIGRLSKLRTVGEITRALHKYSPTTRTAALLEIATIRGHVSPKEASALFHSLRKVKGFENVAKQLVAPNFSNVKGALYEMRIAHVATRSRLKVERMRGLFADNSKLRQTDVDILLRSGKGTRFAVECKAYSGRLPSDMVQADLKSLANFCQQNPGTKPILSLQKEPTALVQKLAERDGVRVLWGDPKAQMEALRDILK